MSQQYDHKQIEKKWQKAWAAKHVYQTKDSSRQKKFYILDMFPYPSGEGLHVGHPKGYIGTDVYSRFMRMQGHNVLHPMGWDAFGLPAENYAIKNKVHPEVAVKKNIKRYKEQLSILGLDYDWSREINTTDPNYYKWTQWIFLQLLKKGLAYESYEPINWCPSCQTGLANEDLEDGKCERCGSVVEKKPMRQWVLKITKYADRLLKDLDKLDWPESIKESQRNWIGRSEGAEINFKIKDEEQNLAVFTTRPDTLFGATYVVVAPEHKILTNLKSEIRNWNEIEKYIKHAAKTSEIDRTAEGKDKTGIKIDGLRAINPANEEELPLFVADYVLGSYGTGAIMAVPAHDERDFQFAKKYDLPIREVISGGDIDTQAYVGSGTLLRSGKFDGLDNESAKKKIIEFVGGKWVTKYKLRDWVFSRQRYWGEPIPVIHCEKCGPVPVPEKDLPIKLPKVKSYAPTGTGESPLAAIEKWVKTKCPKCKGSARRETNTMPQWAGSSWYYLRYLDPKNKKVLADKKKEKYWSPVDLYVGGTEHATRHLIYARFWHKFLKDIGVVNYSEPFSKLKNQGLIYGADGRKMSKRFGNVVNPDEMVARFGADSFRLYEMFMGPFSQGANWNTDGVVGPRRFLEKLWRLRSKVSTKAKVSVDLERKLHRTIKKVTEDIQNFDFNTAISSLMILVNDFDQAAEIPKSDFETILKLISPFAPHFAEELWHDLGNKNFIVLQGWPKAKPDLLRGGQITIVIQVNGKVRGQIMAEEGISEGQAVAEAKKVEAVKSWLSGREILKTIYIQDRLINFVVPGP